jgi:release factor glutamine methyltransferase
MRVKVFKKRVALQMTIQLAYKEFVAKLHAIYDEREAANVADWVIEHVTGKQKLERILNKDLPLTPVQQQELERLTQRLLQHEPVQYALGEAWFFNMKLYVDQNVLIPRPETEELVQWVVEDATQKSQEKNQRIIDIGTGSGCIPIAIKKKLINAEVYALDVSPGALAVARKNALQQKAEITFHELDFLDSATWKPLPMFDVIVSNPPYVKKSEAETMAKNVLQYEPHIALFVPDEDALRFYKAITAFSKTYLTAAGSVYMEINEALGEQVMELFYKEDFKSVTIKKDLQGKDRMIRAAFY